MTSKPRDGTLIALAVLLQLTWGLVPSASYSLIHLLPAELYVAIRWWISGLLFLILMAFMKQLPIPLNWHTLRVVALGVLGYGVGSLTAMKGLELGGVGLFAILSATSPLFVTVASVLFLKEKPKSHFWIASLLVIVGVLIVVTSRNRSFGSQSNTLNAALFVLITYVLEALVFVGSKTYRSRLPGFQYLAITQLSAAAFLSVTLGLSGGSWRPLLDLSLEGWSTLLFVAWVAQVGCYSLLYWLLKHMDGHKLSLYSSIHVLSATFFGVWIFKETLPYNAAFGVLLAFVGLILASRSQTRLIIWGRGVPKSNLKP